LTRVADNNTVARAIVGVSSYVAKVCR
jgi:hypothetical protein